MKNKSLTRIQKDAFSKERLRWRGKAEESKREKQLIQTQAKLFDKNMQTSLLNTPHASGPQGQTLRATEREGEVDIM